MSRYGNNIRRIAQTDELNSRIRQAEQKLNVLDKSAIPGGRGIAYPSGAGQSGSPGVTNPDKNGSPDEKNPSDKDKTDEAGKDGKSTDGGDIINGTKVLQPGEDPGKLALKDCETNEPIDIIMNAASNEGERKFQHPDGWSVDGPPLDPSYSEGSVWYLFAGSDTYFSNNFSGVISAFQAGESFTYCYTIVGGLVSKLTPDAGDAIIQFTNTIRTIGQAPIGGVQYAYTTNPSVTAGQYGRILCGSVSGTEAACAADPPVQYENWQDQDPTYRHQLAFSSQDGGFVSSSNDKDIPAKFRNNVGSGLGLNNLRLCTEDGDEVVMSALIDGTFAYFKEDGFGNPEDENTKVYHFDKDGKYKDIIRPDEYSNLKSTNNPGA